MEVCDLVVATDGDDDTMDLLDYNIKQAKSKAISKKLWWGDGDDEGMTLAVDGLRGEKYDIVIAADVIYEESQVLPLLTTVSG
tara:strand:- start:10 stop:258 length:249 start_codon:yes stop_codon:yes gene_type:complete